MVVYNDKGYAEPNMNKKAGNTPTNLHKRKHVTVETGSDGSSSSSDDATDTEVNVSDIETKPSVNNSDGENSGNNADSDSDGNDQETEDMMKNEGWADSVAKILGTNKPRNKKSLVLSRAKKYSEVVKKEQQPEFDVVGEEKPKIAEIKIETDSIKKRKIDIVTPRVKPNILEKDRERVLAKIATKGVVQLFNAVKNQQNAFSRDINTTGLSEGKKEKILKKFDKRTFLDTLMGQTKSTIVEDRSVLKDEVKEEDKPKWNALRDDFMMGAKMKDWDKTLDDD